MTRFGFTHRDDKVKQLGLSSAQFRGPELELIVADGAPFDKMLIAEALGVEKLGVHVDGQARGAPIAWGLDEPFGELTRQLNEILIARFGDDEGGARRFPFHMGATWMARWIGR